MRIYIKRENCSEGLWMNLPASQNEIKHLYTELEKMHPSSMIPFIAGVESEIQTLAECVEDCTVFKDGHMEQFNELARLINTWEEEERVRFDAALQMDHPDTIEEVMDIANNLDRYILNTRMKNWKEAGRLELEKWGIQVDKKLEPFLDLEAIGTDYVHMAGCMTPMGYVAKQKEIPYKNNESKHPGVFIKEDLLSVHMMDENWKKETFRLPLTEQEKNSQTIKKWNSYAIKDTSGYLEELPCYLPPDTTLSELIRVTDVIYREIVKKSLLNKDKLYAILEAELPERIEDVCKIIPGYENYEYIQVNKIDGQNMMRMMARHYLEIILPKELEPYFNYVEYMKTLHAPCIVVTSTGVVFHADGDFSHRLSGGQNLRLYSPITVTMFRNDSDGFTPEVLSGERLIMQKDRLNAELRRHQPPDKECMGIFLYNQLLRAKVEYMVPEIEAYGGQLCCALKVKTRGALTDAEHKELKNDWQRQMKEGWGMSLIEYPIYLDEGEMHIGLWDDDYGTDLCIKTEEELKGTDITGQKPEGMEPSM